MKEKNNTSENIENNKWYIPPAKHPIRRVIMKYFAMFFICIIFWPRVIAKHKRGRTGPQLLIANHNTIMDPALIYGFYGSKYLHFIAKKPLFDIPVASYFLTSFDIFPIDRQANDLQAARHIIAELKSGNIVGIFIEGGCVDKGDATKTTPKATAVQLAIRKNIPIQLCSVSGKMRLFGRPKVVIGPTVLLTLKKGKRLNKEDSISISHELMRRIYEMGGEEYYNPDEEYCKDVFHTLLDVEVLDDKLNLWENGN